LSSTVPIDTTTIKTLYVFVEIAIDVKHLVDTIRMNFPGDREAFADNLLRAEEVRSQIPAGTRIGQSRHLQIEGPGHSSGQVADDEGSAGATSTSKSPTRLALVSTIQFVAALQELKDNLCVGVPEEAAGSSSSPKLWPGAYSASIPRSKPLSPGEILGCTAPTLSDTDALLYAFLFNLVTASLKRLLDMLAMGAFISKQP
jgi:2-(3-amino-3-carboxypropyl)histidine synthase